MHENKLSLEGCCFFSKTRIRSSCSNRISRRLRAFVNTNFYFLNLTETCNGAIQ